MKKSVVLSVVTAHLLLAGGVLARGEALPASLDALYPPKAPEPKFLLAMRMMDGAFSGMVSDLLQGDATNAAAGFASFKRQYEGVAQLAPEWAGLLPAWPVEQLGKAVASLSGTGEVKAAMAAVENVGRICHTCHMVNMVPVQQKYHWPSFREITVKAPPEGKPVPFHVLMQYLNTAFAGARADIGQGQVENARKQFAGFNALFQTMKGTCEECHGTSERTYYVDAESQALVDAYGKALAAQPADLPKVDRAQRAVGEEICAKCHLVHVPAAMAHELRKAAAR